MFSWRNKETINTFPLKQKCLIWGYVIKYFYLKQTGLYFAFLQLHNENTPIQVYRKFHLQKLKIFR